jgi:hypothetical protein
VVLNAGLLAILVVSTRSFKLGDKPLGEKALETNEIEDINPSYDFQYKVHSSSTCDK